MAVEKSAPWSAGIDAVLSTWALGMIVCRTLLSDYM